MSDYEAPGRALGQQLGRQLAAAVENMQRATARAGEQIADTLVTLAHLPDPRARPLGAVVGRACRLDREPFPCSARRAAAARMAARHDA